LQNYQTSKGQVMANLRDLEYQYINQTEALDNDQYKYDKERQQEKIDKDQGLDKDEKGNDGR